MTAEQMERAIEFLLDHQAQFAADISILKESQAETDRTLSRVVMTVDRISAKVENLTDAQLFTDSKMKEMAEAQIRTQQTIEMVAKSQARTSGELEHFMTAMQQFVTEVRDKLGK